MTIRQRSAPVALTAHDVRGTVLATQRLATRQSHRRRSSPHLHPFDPSRALGRRRGAHPLAGRTSLRPPSWLGHGAVVEEVMPMTDDRDFKQLVRERMAKTGESYQMARRILERKRGRFSALANS